MKITLLIISILISYTCSSQQAPITDPNKEHNWSLILSEGFQHNNLDKWTIRNGDSRWAQEQIFLPDNIQTENGNLKLTLEHKPNGIINGHTNEFYKVGCNRLANFTGGEIFSKKKFLYGYFEAKIKLPDGIGAFPAIWIYPLYRENEHEKTGANQFAKVNFPYPEEIDIIEQRSVQSHNGHSFLYDFCSFKSDQYGDAALDNVFYFSSNYKNLTDGWHILSVEWDMFGQYFYIDGNLFFVNDLWNRETNSESSNFVISNQILTDTELLGSPDCVYHYNSTIADNQTVLFDYTNGINDETFTVDWVRVWQRLKYNNPIVWANPHSNKFGQTMLEGRSNALNRTEIIKGNFLPALSGDEIFTFELNGLSSALQRISNYKEMYRFDVNTMQFTDKETHEDVWSVELINQEKRSVISGQYTLNNWFSPNVYKYTNYAVGNFDGSDRDQILLTNSLTEFATVIKLTDIQSDYMYNYDEIYLNNNAKISYLSNTFHTFYNLKENDQFYSADLNGNGKDELIVFNNSLLMLENISTKEKDEVIWKRIGNIPYTGMLFGDNFIWNFSDSDELLISNFNKTSASDKTEEILLINRITKKAILISYNPITNSLSKIWSNDNSAEIHYWILNSGDYFLCGDITSTNTGGGELALINNTQDYIHIYGFNGANWYEKELIYSPLLGTYEPNDKKYMSYKYNNNNNDEPTNTLFVWEVHSNPHHRHRSTIFPCFSTGICYKNSISLVEFPSSPISLSNQVSSNYILPDQHNTKIAQNFTFYPNPVTNDLLTVYHSNSEFNHLIYNIFDINGKLIKQGEIYNHTTNNINLSSVPSGRYIIFILNGDKVLRSEHIIKQ